MKERIIEVIRGVPIAGKTYEEYVEALAGELENSEFGIQNSELRVAGEFIEVVDEMMECICAMTGVALTYDGRYPELKRKYTEGKGREDAERRENGT